MEVQPEETLQPEMLPLEMLLELCLEQDLVETWDREEDGSYRVKRKGVVYRLTAEQVRVFMKTILLIWQKRGDGLRCRSTC